MLHLPDGQDVTQEELEAEALAEALAAPLIDPVTFEDRSTSAPREVSRIASIQPGFVSQDLVSAPRPL